MANGMAHISLQVPDGQDIDTGNTDYSEAQVDEVSDKGNTEDQDTTVIPLNVSSADEDDEAGSEETTTSGRPGIDEITRHVRENMGEHAEGVIRAMMRDDTQIKQLDADRRRLREAIDEVEEMKASFESEDEEPDEARQNLSNVPPEQIQMLNAWMKDQGYIKLSDLTEREKADAVVASNENAISTFGEDFGKLDEETGEFILNEDAQLKMATIYERVVDDQNLDYSDLYKLANFDQLISSARQQGRNEVQSGNRVRNGARVRQANRASGVAINNTGGSSTNQLYNRGDYRDGGGEKAGGFAKISDVLNKARRAAQSA